MQSKEENVCLSISTTEVSQDLEFIPSRYFRAEEKMSTVLVSMTRNIKRMFFTKKPSPCRFKALSQ